MPPVGSSTEERLNNAIYSIGQVSRRAESAGVRKAIADLAKHWASFFDSAERRNTPTEALSSKLGRYADWYTRAYYLLSPDLRALCVAPTQIDVSFSSIVEDRINKIAEGARAADAAGKSLGEVIEKNAAGLAKQVGSLSMSVGLLLLGAVGIYLTLMREKKA